MTEKGEDCVNCGKRQTLGRSSSTSFKGLPGQWTTDYSSSLPDHDTPLAKVSGTLCSDALGFGGGRVLKAANFGVAKTVAAEFAVDWL